MKSYALLLAVLLCAGCGGGGTGASSPVPSSKPTSAPFVAPTIGPTSAPTNAPSPNAKNRAVANATALGKGQIVSTTAATAARRGTLAVGVPNSLPAVIESIGDLNEGTSINVWEYDTTTGLPVADGAPTITPTDPLATSLDPTFETTGIPGFVDAYQAGVNALEIGQTGEFVAFANASGTVPVDIYDGYQFRCDGQLTYAGYVFSNGAIAHTTTSAGADFYMDCSTPGSIAIEFPHGGVVAQAPVLDAYGNTETSFTTFLSAPTVTSTPLSITNANTQNGEIVAFNTGEGRVAKLMFTNNPGDDPLGTGIFGLVMEANSSGAFAY